MNPNKFTYSHNFFQKFSDFLNILFALCSLILGIVFLSASISNGDIFLAFLYFLAFVIWMPFLLFSMSFQHEDIEVKTDGLLINFVFKSLFVEWKDIKSIKPSKFLGMRILSWGNIVVVKKGLTQFHRIYGLGYGQTIQPAFLIMTDIHNYKELVSIIKSNIKKTKEKNDKKKSMRNL